MLDGLTQPLSLAKLARGEQTPVLFGSAMTNFGVQLLLDTLMELGSPPMPRALDAGDGADFTSGELSGDEEMVEPASADFSGFVFKLQACPQQPPSMV